MLPQYCAIMEDDLQFCVISKYLLIVFKDVVQGLIKRNVNSVLYS